MSERSSWILVSPPVTADEFRAGVERGLARLVARPTLRRESILLHPDALEER